MAELKKVVLENSDEVMRALDPDLCDGEKCCLHNRTDNCMRCDRQHWRDDLGFMERICVHGVGHPDPDDEYAEPVHGCDGCCNPVGRKS